MSRPRKTFRPIRLNTTLPQDLMDQIEAYLKRRNGGVVRRGELQKFLVDRIRAFFLEQEYSKCFKEGKEK